MKTLKSICFVFVVLFALGFVSGCKDKPLESVPAPTSIDVSKLPTYEILLPEDCAKIISFSRETGNSLYPNLELLYQNNSGELALVIYKDSSPNFSALHVYKIKKQETIKVEQE